MRYAKLAHPHVMVLHADKCNYTMSGNLEACVCSIVHQRVERLDLIRFPV